METLAYCGLGINVRQQKPNTRYSIKKKNTFLIKNIHLNRNGVYHVPFDPNAALPLLSSLTCVELVNSGVSDSTGRQHKSILPISSLVNNISPQGSAANFSDSLLLRRTDMDALKSAGRAIIRSPSMAKQSWTAGRHRSKRKEKNKLEIAFLNASCVFQLNRAKVDFCFPLWASHLSYCCDKESMLHLSV